MGAIGTLGRLLLSIAVFIVVIIAGIILAPSLTDFFRQLPGTFEFTSGNTSIQVPLVASIVASLLLTLVINLIALPFRRRNL
jgi:Protein of unknown function (DUF2905)